MRTYARPSSAPASRGPLVAVLALGLVATGCASAAAAGHHRAPCPPAGSHQVAKGRLVRVYETSSGVAPNRRVRVSACERGTGHAPMTLIAPRSRPPGVSLGAVAIAGTLVAYVETTFGVDSGSSRIVVVDVSARRVLRSLPAGAYVDAGIIRREHVRALAVAADGAIGWILERGRAQAEKRYVYEASRTGPVSLLDEGADIGAESLQISGRTLSWQHAGTRRSALLPG
jgi:hypothetical protein